MAIAPMTESTQCLTFGLDKEVFAIDIARVREVLEYTTLTKVPRMPDYVRGVINLRGSVVPVFDLRLKFGLPMIEKTISTCIIITEVNVGENSAILGAMVDSVQEVLEIGADKIEPAPHVGTHIRIDFIKGMGKHKDNFIIILNTDNVFSEDELTVEQDTTRILHRVPQIRRRNAGD
ncbi:MAG: chemotaxis protein CheW [Nitrospirae bacterium]|nr:chemotaxis protein CheW [Nitrospirota bacterium]